jgi:hypothetical protein
MSPLKLHLARQSLIRERDEAIEKLAGYPAEQRQVAEEYAERFRALVQAAQD